MAILDSLNQTADTAISKSEEFIRNTEAYYELKAFQMLSSSLSLIVKSILLGALSLIALILLAIALSTIIGNALNSHVWGYVITALIFAVLAVIVYGLRNKIENLIIRQLSKKILN